MFSRKRGCRPARPRDDARAVARRCARRRLTPATTSDAAPPEHGPYDVADAPDGVAAARPGQPADPGASTGSRCGCRPTRTAPIAAGRAGRTATARCSSACSPRRAPRASGTRSATRSASRLSPTASPPQEVDGEYGTELRARVRTRRALADVRFVGVDGPRWLVRALFQGPAAADPAAAGPLGECLRRPRGGPRRRGPAGARGAAAAAAAGDGRAGAAGHAGEADSAAGRRRRVPTALPATVRPVGTQRDVPALPGRPTERRRRAGVSRAATRDEVMATDERHRPAPVPRAADRLRGRAGRRGAAARRAPSAALHRRPASAAAVSWSR